MIDFKSQIDMYEALEQGRDPALLVCNKMLETLPSLCEECGMSELCPCKQPKNPDYNCPAAKAMVGIVSTRSRLIAKASDPKPWIGIDLDGTLAKDLGDAFNELTIGEPVQPMVEFVKSLVSRGIKVKIFTARMNSAEPNPTGVARAIRKWTKKYIGVPLESTAEKDYLCTGIFDDRAHQVIRDQGLLLEALYENLNAEVKEYRAAAVQAAITGNNSKQ